MDILANKSEAEIRRAVTFWFMAAEYFQQGGYVSPNVFCLSMDDPIPEDIEEARQLFPEEFIDQAALVSGQRVSGEE